MGMTLLAKVLWFCWVFMIVDFVIVYTDTIGKAGVYVKAFFGLITIITVIAIALLPFVNLLWK